MHEPRLYSLSPENIERFWSMVDRGGEDDHWEWKGATHPHNGQGVFDYHDGRVYIRVQARRIAYQLSRGYPTQRALTCPGHTLCMNPKHIRGYDDPTVVIAPEEEPKINQIRTDLERWMAKHRNQSRRGVRSGKELQDISG